MPFDAAFTSAITKELGEKLIGARIDKIQQPERDVILLSVRSQRENLKVLISSAGGSARVHITSRSMENPIEPPMFCMLMRKHLTGARIFSVTQPEYERMIVFELDTRDELGIEARKKLIVEMIGSLSNIVLVGADGRIIDCIRRMDYGADALRRMQPGMIYRMPTKQNKTPFFSCDTVEYSEFARSIHGEVSDKPILAKFSGLSPLICRELAYRSKNDADNLAGQMIALREAVDNAEFSPYIITQDGEPKDYSFMYILQYADAMKCERYPDFSGLLDAFYERREKTEHMRRRTHELTHTVKTARDRIERKLAGQTEELRRTDERESVRIMAELVTANIYRLRKGDRVLECENYYEPDMPLVKIPLDPLKTPQQNSTALYKQYNKLKTAREHLTILVEQGSAQLDYLNSVLDELDRAENERDIAEIRRELAETGYLRRQKGSRQEKIKQQGPMRFVSDDGYEILVGRSNTQNDELTMKTARRTDIWLHTQKVHGSHVVIRCDGLEPPHATLLQAASLAVYYSQGRNAGKIPVDHTMIKFVRKPSGALPGMVIYTDYSTLIAEADEELVNRLKK